MYLRGKKVDITEVLNNPKYTEYERRKALKYEKILFDVEVEINQLRRFGKKDREV